ncbi:MAG: cell division protein ZapA, partial [Betaproteobacteria bacterium]
ELLATRTRGGFDIGEFKRRINLMESMLDTTMPGQDKLF